MLTESPEAFCCSGRTAALLKKTREKKNRVQSADLIFEITNKAIALDLHDFSNKESSQHCVHYNSIHNATS